MFERRDGLTIACFSLVILLLGLALSLNGGMAGAGGRAPAMAGSAWQPRNMALVGQIGGPAYAVAVQGNHAYLGIGPRLWVLDVSGPAHPPAVVGVSEEMPDYVSDVDVADPAAPTPVSVYEESGGRAMAVADGYVYLAQTLAGLSIVDVSDPQRPVPAGS